MRDGVVVPSALALSHDEQLGRLARYCPPAADVAAVVGDLCLDRMVASAHLRQAYRCAFDAVGTRRLVVVSSTWGPRSLYGRWPRLLPRLLAELPVDQYAVVAAWHPNIWHGHSPWQVRGWLAECLDAGLTLLPAWEGWRAALVGADVVIGDHGSVTFYAAALGRPVLIGASDPDGVDPDSPVAQFTAAAPRLSPDASLVDQLEAVMSTGGQAGYRDILAQATSVPGRAALLTRQLLYRLLQFTEPARPATTSVIPVPTVTEVDRRPVTALLVRACADVGHDRDLVRLERFPADLTLDDPPPGDTHLLVRWRHHDVRLLAVADVLLGEPADVGGSATAWIRDTLRTYPGCAVAAVSLAGGGCVAGLRAGGLVTVQAVIDVPEQAPPDAALLASAVYVRRTTGAAPGGMAWQVEVAGTRYRLLVTALAGR